MQHRVFIRGARVAVAGVIALVTGCEPARHEPTAEPPAVDSVGEVEARASAPSSGSKGVPEPGASARPKAPAMEALAGPLDEMESRDPDSDFIIEPASEGGCARVRWRRAHPDPEDAQAVLTVEHTFLKRARPYEHGPYIEGKEARRAWHEQGSKAARTITRQGHRLIVREGLSLMEACARLEAEHDFDYIEVVESFQTIGPPVREVIRFLHGGKFIEQIDPAKDLPAFDSPLPADAGDRPRCKKMKCKRALDLGPGIFDGL